jgi:hypothetical protein
MHDAWLHDSPRLIDYFAKPLYRVIVEKGRKHVQVGVKQLPVAGNPSTRARTSHKYVFEGSEFAAQWHCHISTVWALIDLYLLSLSSSVHFLFSKIHFTSDNRDIGAPLLWSDSSGFFFLSKPRNRYFKIDQGTERWRKEDQSNHFSCGTTVRSVSVGTCILYLCAVKWRLLFFWPWSLTSTLRHYSTDPTRTACSIGIYCLECVEGEKAFKLGITKPSTPGPLRVRRGRKGPHTRSASYCKIVAKRKRKKKEESVVQYKLS